MNIRIFLFPALVTGALLALIRWLFAKAADPMLDRTKSHTLNPTYDVIDDFIETQRRRLNIPGMSFAIVEGDQIVHTRGFGVARPGGETPSPQTPFIIGSLTKSITALAILQLVEAGKVELDAPVQRYLPWFRVANSDGSARMTVRHLLNQTSGLPMMPSEEALDNIDDHPDAVERQVRSLANLKLSHPVGAKCEYSNFNYNILGLIVEAASGESYTNYIQKHIFEPLEMRHSYAYKAEAKQNSLAVGHRHWFGVPFPAPDFPVPIGSLPAGYLISCAEDLAHYLVAQLNGGRYLNTRGEVQILSPAGIDTMHRGVAELKMGELSGGFYGMGWFDIDLGQTKTYSHGGNVPDFSAFMAIVPVQKKGLVMLANADPYGLPMVMEEVGMGATALLAGLPPDPIKLDFIKWVFRLLPLIPLLQVAGAIATVAKLRRWQNEPALLPAGGKAWRRHLLLPLAPDLSLAALLASLQASGLLRFLHLFMPDLAWIVRISGSFAVLWAFVRTGLVSDALRRRSQKALKEVDS